MESNTLIYQYLKTRALEDPSFIFLVSGLINALLGPQNLKSKRIGKMASNMTEPRLLVYKMNVFFAWILFLKYLCVKLKMRFWFSKWENLSSFCVNWNKSLINMLVKLSAHKIDLSDDPTIQSEENGNIITPIATSFYITDPIDLLNHSQFYKQS